MYCRDCNYPLNDLGSPQCPECGRAFDTDNPRTFLRMPRQPWWRKLCRWGMRLAIVVTLIVLVFVAVGEWQYRRIAAVESLGGSVGTAYLGPQWVRKFLPVRYEKSLFSKVFAVIFSEKPVTDADMAVLDRFDLRDLDDFAIHRGHVTAAGLARVASMTNLLKLSLSGCPVRDDALVYVAHLPRLRSLSLADTNIEGSGLVHLRGLKSLSELGLRATGVDYDDLRHLQSLPSLTKLYLTNTDVSDAEMEVVSRMHMLVGLGLDGTKVTDEGMAKLIVLPRLLMISIHDTPVTDAGLMHLCEISSLHSVLADFNPITREGANAARWRRRDVSFQISRRNLR